MTCVTASRSMARRTRSGSNCSRSTNVAPRNIAGIIVTKAPLNTSEPAWSTTLSGVIRHCEANSRPYAARTAYESTIPLGVPVVPLLYMMLKTSSGAIAGTDGDASGGTPAINASTWDSSVRSRLASASAASARTASARRSGLSGTVAAPILAAAQ